MHDYRLYFIRAGHIHGVRELQAKDDAEAIVQAEAARSAQPAELWNRARPVKVFEAGDGHAASGGSAQPPAAGLWAPRRHAAGRLTINSVSAAAEQAIAAATAIHRRLPTSKA